MKNYRGVFIQFSGEDPFIRKIRDFRLGGGSSGE